MMVGRLFETNHHAAHFGRAQPLGRGAAQHAEGSGAGGGKRQPGQKGKAWVLKKKEQMRGKGVPVPDDSKYTARKRRPTF